MNKKIYQSFMKHLDNEDKDQCTTLIMDILAQGESVRSVYEDYLIPALANYNCNDELEEICIWKEHARTSIIRTILEATYPYLIKEKHQTVDKMVLIACPQEEYHEIGAIIATNYFALAGFNAKYIGANTPSEQIISAVRIMKPDILALSITNFYNVVAAKKLTESLKKEFQDLIIVIGGQATANEQIRKQLTFDHMLNSYDDIMKLKEELA